MTLIMGVICQDGVILSGDGKITNDELDTLKLDAQKVFHICNGVHWALAADYLSDGENERLAVHVRKFMDLTPPYTMKDVADSFSYIVDSMHIGRPTGFWVGFLVAGYGRDNTGKAVNPRIYRIHSKNNYIPELGSHIALGNWKGKNIDLGQYNLHQTTTEAAKMHEKIIRREEKTIPQVGGDIRTVIIKDMGKKKFKELIKRASQPVPKEQGQQPHPDSYSGKQTRSHKTANTSAKQRGKSHQ